MSLQLADLQSYIQTAFPEATVGINRLPEANANTPDEMIVLVGNGGGATLFDGAFEEAFVMIRTRGNPDDDITAETMGLQVHRLLGLPVGSFQMGGTYVLFIQPVSGPHAYAGQDVSLRSVYEGHYRLVVLV